MAVREQGLGPPTPRRLWAPTALPAILTFSTCRAFASPLPAHLQPGTAVPSNLLNGEPVATEMFHDVYVIVAEEAQADLAERAGRHHLCHSHLQEGGELRRVRATLSPACWPVGHSHHSNSSSSY